MRCLSAVGTGCDSPPWKCRVEFKSDYESRSDGTEKAFNRKDRGDYAENAERTGTMNNNVPGEQRSS